MQDHEMRAWLGPALDELTADQITRLHAESDAIDERYPEPDDEMLRQTALAAAVQYLLGETTPEGAGRALAAARRVEGEAFAASMQIARMACDDRLLTEVDAAAVCRIDRMSVRRARGKR
jgi:uncharacterized protein YcfJ